MTLNQRQTESVRGPLDGISVVAIEQSVAGPLCSRVLADLGADVLKVERRSSGGDFSRHWDHDAAGESSQFWWLNRGKRSVALDLRDSADRRTLHRIMSGADVLVHNMSPEAADRLGVAGPALLGQNPAVINCQISGYGNDTALRDRKAYDMLVQAESGIMSLTGTREVPMRVGVSICDVATGLYAAILVLGALHRRATTGQGAFLDVAMFDVGIEFIGPMLTSFANAGVEYPRIGQHHHAIAPYGVFECADGHLVLAVEQDAEWARLCETVLGDGSLAVSPRFARNADRIKNRDEVDAIVSEAFGKLSIEEAISALAGAGLAYARVNEIKDIPEHPVTRDRGCLATTRSAAGDPVTAPVGLAARLLSSEASGVARPPSLGEHNLGVLNDLEAWREDGNAMGHRP